MPDRIVKEIQSYGFMLLFFGLLELYASFEHVKRFREFSVDGDFNNTVYSTQRSTWIYKGDT
jgi:hypothetical protein